jgi:molecular chaperone DnaK (HSP70)
VNVRFDFDVNGMLHVSATDRGSGVRNSVSVQATQARLTPHEIAEARERLAELNLIGEGEEAIGQAKPVIDEETQALLNRAQSLLDGGNLSKEDAEELTDLMRDILDADSQDEVDDLAEELLDALFDLE